MAWFFFNGNSELSVCVQSSFTPSLPAPLCSLLSPSLPPGLLPPAFPWECFSCLLPSPFSPCWFTRPSLSALSSIWAQAPCCACLGRFPCDEHPAAAPVGVQKEQVLPWHPSQAHPNQHKWEAPEFLLVPVGAASENKQLFKCVQKCWIGFGFAGLAFEISGLAAVCLSVGINRDGTWMGAVSHWA